MHHDDRVTSIISKVHHGHVSQIAAEKEKRNLKPKTGGGRKEVLHHRFLDVRSQHCAFRNEYCSVRRGGGREGGTGLVVCPSFIII